MCFSCGNASAIEEHSTAGSLLNGEKSALCYCIHGDPVWILYIMNQKRQVVLV